MSFLSLLLDHSVKQWCAFNHESDSESLVEVLNEKLMCPHSQVYDIIEHWNSFLKSQCKVRGNSIMTMQRDFQA